MNELSLFDSLFNNTMDSVFNNYRTVSVPKVDVKETENAYSLDMELPGEQKTTLILNLITTLLQFLLKRKKLQKRAKVQKRTITAENGLSENVVHLNSAEASGFQKMLTTKT